MDQGKFGGLKERIILHRLLGVSCVGLVIFLTGFTIVPALMAEASAESANLAISWQTVSLVLDSDADDTSTSVGDIGHGDIIFANGDAITPVENNIAESGSSYGRLTVVKKRIGVATSGTYYSIYISTATDQDALTIGDESNFKIEPTSGSWSSPITFTENGGSGWGFAVPNTTIPRSTSIATAPDFSSSVAPASILDAQISYTTTGAETYYADSVWSAVPDISAPQQIWKESNTLNDGYGFGTYEINGNSITSPHSDATDSRYKSFDIYYAVAVDTNIVAGTYTNNIVYTALASASSLDTVSTNLVRNLAYGGEGDTQTLRFDLNDSAASITSDMITVALVPHSTIVSENYSVSNLNIEDYDTCNIETLRRDAAAGYTEITCTTPAHAPESGSGDGTFDYWVNIAGYNYNYLSKINYTSTNESTGITTTSYIGAFVYAGLQSESAPSDARYVSGEKIVTELQQMTGGVCKETNMWGETTAYNSDTDSEDLSQVHLYDNTGDNEITVGVNKTGISDGIGTFALIDTRDNKRYLVRRFPTGNCWMAQNLNLNLADFAGHNPSNTQNLNLVLTNKNTDLNTEGKTYWDPSESVADWAEEYGLARTATFAELTDEMLGSAQSIQYLPKGTFGTSYRWASRKNSAGELIATDESGNALNASGGRIQAFRNDGVYVENNANAELPRSYDNGYDYINKNTFAKITNETYQEEYSSQYIGGYYNYYAATAESGNYRVEKATDSICPYGWQLPAGQYETTSDPKLYDDLIGFYYYDGNTYVKHTLNDATTAKSVKSFPISLSLYGVYDMVSGNLAIVGTQSGYSFFQSRARSNRYSYDYTVDVATLNSNRSFGYTGYGMPLGLSVRCVARD
ncbi:hypothetical protein IJG96_02150 [Candidatus Saccharibacteria bacterium]|nr:hypothetical protein [Candidatus Saccharibacteria bacterium]